MKKSLSLVEFSTTPTVSYMRGKDGCLVTPSPGQVGTPQPTGSTVAGNSPSAMRPPPGSNVAAAASSSSAPRAPPGGSQHMIGKNERIIDVPGGAPEQTQGTENPFEME